MPSSPITIASYSFLELRYTSKTTKVTNRANLRKNHLVSGRILLSMATSVEWWDIHFDSKFENNILQRRSYDVKNNFRFIAVVHLQ